jgi:hypothetical protein
MIVECQRQLVAADGVAQDIRDLSTQTNNEKKKNRLLLLFGCRGYVSSFGGYNERQL